MDRLTLLSAYLAVIKEASERFETLTKSVPTKELLAKSQSCMEQEDKPVKLWHFAKSQHSEVKPSPVSYWYKEGTPTEEKITKSSTHKMSTTLKQPKLYDLGEDPDKVIEKVRSEKNQLKKSKGSVKQDVIDCLKKSGYEGIVNSKSKAPGVVGLFKSVAPEKCIAKQEGDSSWKEATES